jgi:hypothetical protein
VTSNAQPPGDGGGDHVLTERQLATVPLFERIAAGWWTPHVTLGVRLVSVLDDDMQHVGQAAYLRGILLRRG